MLRPLLRGPPARILSIAILAIGYPSGAAACSVQFGLPSNPWPSPSDPCYEIDLAALPTGSWVINDTFPQPYTVTAPCSVIDNCGCPAVQNREDVPGCDAGIQLGYLAKNSTVPILGPEGDLLGINLTLSGGNDEIGCTSGRSVVYNLVCNKSVPISNPPQSPITVRADRCTYVVTWHSPAACAAQRNPGSCSSPSVSGPLPTANQLRYQMGEIVALTHFNMATFVKNGDPGCDASNWNQKAVGAEGPSSDPATFNPVHLNTSQWAEVYQRVGVKGAVLTAKHGCGYLLWPTKITLPGGSPYTYGVGKAKSAIQVDVLDMFSKSMLAANITHGFYYSLTNNFFLNVRSHNAHASPNILPGQIDVNQSEFERIALGHVSELWSNYGQLGEIWFDGGYTGDMATGIEKLIAQQKLAVGFGGSGVMSSPVGWIGTESGMPGFPHIWSTGGNGAGDPLSDQWMPKCCDTTLQDGDVWFFEPGTPVRSLATLIEVYHQTVGRNGVLELDFAINRDGLVDPIHEQRYAEFGDWINECYGEPVGSIHGGGATVLLQLPAATTIDRTMIREDQSQGQRVRRYTIEALVSGNWQQFAAGSGIGNKQIDIAVHAVSATALRLNITAAISSPIVTQFAAFAPCRAS